MRSTQLLYGVIAGFSAGVVLGTISTDRLPVIGLLAVFAVSILLLSTFLRAARHEGFLVALVICSCALGAARMEIAERSALPPLSSSLGQEFVVEGSIVAEPDHRETSERLIVETEEGRRFLVVADPYPRVVYGAIVRAEGVLTEPENFEGESGRLFNYVGYLAKDDIHYVLRRASVATTGEGGGNQLRGVLFGIKRGFLAHLERLIPEPQSALLGGLLLGGKQSLGEDLIDAFTTAGIIHIVVLSGFNMTIIAYALMRVFGTFLAGRTALVAGALGIVLFCLMVGLSATVARAGAMALLALWAAALGRRYVIVRALFLVAFVMLLIDPFLLLFDPSFQLSFLATFGLITLAPIVTPRVTFVPERWGLREIVVATLATQIFVLPFILWMTGELSFVALPANLLILPLIPITMLFGFIAGSLSFLHSMLALPFAWVATGLLSVEIFFARFFAGLPGASVLLPPFPLALTLAAYVPLLYLIRTWYKSDSSTLGGGTTDGTHPGPGIARSV